MLLDLNLESQLSETDQSVLSSLTHDRQTEMKKTEVKFPFDNEFTPTDYNSQLMFDFEGLEERKLWCLGHNDLLNQVEHKIRNLVKVNELYNLVDLVFDMDQDLNKMKDNMVVNWKELKKNSPKELKSSL